MTLSHRLAIELMKREYAEEQQRVGQGAVLRQLNDAGKVRRAKVLRAARGQFATRRELKADRVIYMGCTGWTPPAARESGIVQVNGWINVAETSVPLERVVEDVMMAAAEPQAAACG